MVVVLLLLLAQAASSALDPLPISLESSQLISEWIASSSISLQLLMTLCKSNPRVLEGIGKVLKLVYYGQEELV